MYLKYFTSIVIFSLFLISCGEKKEDIHVPEKEQYRNPVINMSAPDPTVIYVEGDGYYLYATEDIRNMPIFHSSDLVTWTRIGTVFNESSRPAWEKGGGLWAPDINYINGKYVLYYSMAVWDNMQTSGIGIAVSNTPKGPFNDLGPLIRSHTVGVKSSIDPCYFEENNKKYLFWGSYFDIFAIELNEDGLSIKEGATKKKIAGNAFEGTYIHKRGKYYYMFASTGTCCEGINSTYTTVVGRSENILGPYVDKKGQSMLQNHYEIVISRNSSFVGTGHNAEIIQDMAKNDWILYHAYSLQKENGRNVLLDRVHWKDDWPVVVGNSPSTLADKPIFY